MQPEATTSDRPVRRDGAPGEGLGHVLLVDDGDTNRMIAAAMLRRAGYSVDEAFDGAEAVSMALQGRYVAILMDLAMPVMDGMEATLSIRELPAPHCETPIVALTAHDTPSDRIRCLEAGMDDYIAKPLRYTELVDVMQRTVRARGVTAPDCSKEAVVAASQARRLQQSDLDPSDLIDDGKLRQLEQDAGPEAMRNLIEMFVKEAWTLSKILQNKENNEDVATLQRTAHSLKSSAAAFGARALEVVGAAAEKAYARSDMASAATVLGNLPDLVAATEAVFKERGLV